MALYSNTLLVDGFTSVCSNSVRRVGVRYYMCCAYRARNTFVPGQRNVGVSGMVSGGLFLVLWSAFNYVRWVFFFSFCVPFSDYLSVCIFCMKYKSMRYTALCNILCTKFWLFKKISIKGVDKFNLSQNIKI